jgi:hypothetical protein
MTRHFKRALIGAAVSVACAASASAQRASVPAENRIENQVAVFAALDKVTARISKLEIPLGESVIFGALTVTPRSCYTRSPLETPKTSTFVEVAEKQLDGQVKRIFGGWMFAESPGLNAVEHPVYDVWLTECAKPKVTASAAPAAKGAQPSAKGSQPKAATPPATAPAAAQPGAQPPPAPAPAAAAGEAVPADDFKRRRPPR